MRCVITTLNNASQKFLDRRPVCRTGSNMMQPNHSVRVDQNVAAPLMDIVRGLMQFLPFQQLLQIDPPVAWGPQIPERSIKHVILKIDFAFSINQQWPFQSGFRNILTGKKVVFKGNNDDFDLEPAKLGFMITQLRDVRPAGQSAQMAVKYHQ